MSILLKPVNITGHAYVNSPVEPLTRGLL